MGNFLSALLGIPEVVIKSYSWRIFRRTSVEFLDELEKVKGSFSMYEDILGGTSGGFIKEVSQETQSRNSGEIYDENKMEQLQICLRKSSKEWLEEFLNIHLKEQVYKKFSWFFFRNFWENAHKINTKY